MLNSIALIGMAQSQGGSPQGGMLGMFLPLIVIFVIFYFLLIRPQQKQQKKLQEMLTNLHKGDAIVTRGGLHGKINDIDGNLLSVEIANNVVVKINRDAVVTIAAGK